MSNLFLFTKIDDSINFSGFIEYVIE